ncbi:MAG: hypothetical protein P4L54_10680, partial [Acidocella sp.]|nr:hypothetical protein [Acidocella sp.]
HEPGKPNPKPTNHHNPNQSSGHPHQPKPTQNNATNVSLPSLFNCQRTVVKLFRFRLLANIKGTVSGTLCRPLDCSEERVLRLTEAVCQRYDNPF